MNKMIANTISPGAMAGTGRFARRFSRYEVVPQHVAASLREAAKP